MGSKNSKNKTKTGIMESTSKSWEWIRENNGKKEWKWEGYKRQGRRKRREIIIMEGWWKEEKIQNCKNKKIRKRLLGNVCVCVCVVMDIHRRLQKQSNIHLNTCTHTHLQYTRACIYFTHACHKHKKNTQKDPSPTRIHPPLYKNLHTHRRTNDSALSTYTHTQP